VAYKAFRRAFGSRSDVLLRLHFRETAPVGVRFADKNVEAIAGVFPLEELRGLYQQADCLVFLVARVGVYPHVKLRPLVYPLSPPIGAAWRTSCRTGASR